MQRIGLYGGSFDPIHHGHLISARSLAERLGLERVLIIVAARPPHKQHVRATAFAHRYEMARRAVDGDPLFQVLDIEARREGPSYTIDTVAALRAEMGNEPEFFWFIGGDTLPALHTWHRARELVRQVTIVTATRPGWTPPDLQTLAKGLGESAARMLLSHCIATPSIAISATDIRRRRAAGLPIRYLIPPSVEEYIQTSALYSAESADPSDNGPSGNV